MSLYGKLAAPVIGTADGYATFAIAPDLTLHAFGNANAFVSIYPPPSGLTDLNYLAVGNSQTALYVKADGTVGGWGSDSYSWITGPSAFTSPKYLGRNYDTCLVDQNDTLHLWGADTQGESTPLAVTANNTIMADTGRYWVAALLLDGTVVAWGDNGSGQTNVPTGLSGVVQIATGYRHGAALKGDGTVVAWGDNGRGQTNVPAGLSGVVQVTCGRYHTLALKDDGTIVGWGDNGNGQLNPPAGAADSVQVNARGSSSMAVASNGEIFHFGYDSGTGEDSSKPPAGTTVYAPSSKPTGSVDATLSFQPSLSGSIGPSGDLAATLGFSVSFNAARGASGDLATMLSFGSSLTGKSVTHFGALSSSLEISASVSGYQDWTRLLDPLALQEVYELTLTGANNALEDLVVPISSWQATSQAGGRQSYLQAVVPSASELIDGMANRADGELVIRKGYRFSDGSRRLEEILRARLNSLRYDRGPRAFTVTLSGYREPVIPKTGGRTLTGVRSLSVNNGKRRVRCDIDLFLQPGMTVSAAGESFTASYINYYVNEADKFCEIGER